VTVGEWRCWLHALAEVEDNGKRILRSHYRAEETTSE
jgi:hypothetical protein